MVLTGRRGVKSKTKFGMVRMAVANFSKTRRLGVLGETPFLMRFEKTKRGRKKHQDWQMVGRERVGNIRERERTAKAEEMDEGSPRD